MAKYANAVEDNHNFVMGVINKRAFGNVRVVCLHNSKQAQMVTCNVGSKLLKSLKDVDLIFILNEEMFDLATETTKEILVDAALNSIIVKPDGTLAKKTPNVQMNAEFINALSWDKVNTALLEQDSIKEQFEERKAAEAEKKTAKKKRG